MKQYFKPVALLGIAFSAFLVSCSKNETEQSSSQPLVENMEELTVSSTFDWSASINTPLSVSFLNPDNVSLENEYVHLVDAQGNVYEKAIVENASVGFNLLLPQDKDFFLLFPYTGNQYAVANGGSVSLTLTKDGVGKKSVNKTNAGSCTVCVSPFENGTAELPAITIGRQTQTNQSNVPGWETTATDGRIEIWSTGFNSVPAQEGNQFLELNATQVSTLYQTLCLEPGATIRWSVYHRGRAGVDVAAVKIGATLATATLQATMTDGKTDWGYYTGTYVIPAGQTTTLFAFEAVSAAGGSSIGNFIDNFRIECDIDGDGIADTQDDYPTDPIRAYKSFFPTAGNQTVAFEDLWPSTGDYDFNDLVLNSKVEISKNAAGNLVDATFKIAINAIGAGLNNGIALMLHNANKTSLSSNVIASVTGDASLDPANTNGLILTNDVFGFISSYYQNNNFGPSKTPDTLTFTVNFVSGVTSFLPEPYLFRTVDRGLEIHMSGYPTTATINQTYLSSMDDTGDFKTASGLPWAIEIVSANQFQQPNEKVDILQAYAQFQLWATSLGADNTSWYNTPVASKVFGE